MSETPKFLDRLIAGRPNGEVKAVPVRDWPGHVTLYRVSWDHTGYVGGPGGGYVATRRQVRWYALSGTRIVDSGDTKKYVVQHVREWEKR